MDVQELLYWLVVGILVGGIIILIASKLIVNIIEVQVKVNKPTGSFIDGKQCSSYNTESACVSASCKWCPKCDTNIVTRTNQWRADECVSSGTDCGYNCIKGECDAECTLDVDCMSPNHCDNLCKCRTT